MGDNSELFNGIIRVLAARPNARIRVVVVEVDGAGGDIATPLSRSPTEPEAIPDPPLAVDRVFRIKWNVQGHGIIATVALEGIIQDEAPAVYAKIKTMLKDDPLDRNDIVKMAQWPDRIKPPAQPPFNKWSWLGKKHRSEHYINYGIDDPKAPSDAPTPMGDKTTLLDALPVWVKKLQTETDATERGHALAFITHLVGDIHQPLHCAVLCGDLFPKKDFSEGDRGGNLVWWGDTQNFHSLWDGLICKTSDEVAMAVANLQDGLDRKNYKARLNDHPTFSDWAIESYRIAADVYARFLADTKYLHRDTRTNKDGDDQEGQLFESPSREYRKWAKDLAYEQGRVAAFRLADKLIEILG